MMLEGLHGGGLEAPRISSSVPNMYSLCHVKKPSKKTHNYSYYYRTDYNGYIKGVLSTLYLTRSYCTKINGKL